MSRGRGVQLIQEYIKQDIELFYIKSHTPLEGIFDNSGLQGCD